MSSPTASALFQGTQLDGIPVSQFPGIGHIEDALFRHQTAGIPQLSAPFCVESRVGQDYSQLITSLGLFDGLSFMDWEDGGHFAVLAVFVHRQLAQAQMTGLIEHGLPFLIVPCCTGSFPLGFHGGLEALLVHGEALFFQDLFRQFPGEPEGIVQLEGIFALQDGASLLAHGIDLLVQQVGALFQGLQEAVFFHGDDLFNVGTFFLQIGVVLPVHVDDQIRSPHQEFLADAQQTPVADGPAQYPAQDVAPAFVGRQDAVADHEGDRTGVVRNDLQGNVVFGIRIVFLAGNLAGVFDDREDQVGFKVGGLFLQYRSHPFQTQAGIDVLMLQRRIAAVRLFVVLGKYQVPQFQEPAAVAARATFRTAAAPVFAQIDMDFGVRAARAATGDFPPVVFQFYDPFGRYAAHIMPQVISFLVLGIYRDPQFVGWQFQYFRQEFPGPGDHFLFEVIAEREVPQHFKIRMVAGSTAHVLDIPGTYTFLAGGDAGRRRFDLTGEIRLEGRHTGTDQKQRRIIMRDQGCTGQYQMAPFLEEVQIFLSNLITT